MAQRVAPKQYARLTDLAARRDPRLDDYMEEIGWPWRATQAQLDDWNAWMAAQA